MTMKEVALGDISVKVCLHGFLISSEKTKCCYCLYLFQEPGHASPDAPGFLSFSPKPFPLPHLPSSSPLLHLLPLQHYHDLQLA